jgi:hypothetical protein
MVLKHSKLTKRKRGIESGPDTDVCVEKLKKIKKKRKRGTHRDKHTHKGTSQ